MFAIRPGRVSRSLCLDDVLRQRWDEMRQANRAEIEKRTKLGVPLDDLEELDAYEGTPEHKGVFVTLRAVSRSLVMETDIRIKEISDAVASKKEASEKLRADLDTFGAMRFFVSKSVASVSGFYDDDGAFEIGGNPELSDDDVEFLDQNGLLFALFSVAKAYQYLSGDEKKRFGLHQQQTYQPRNLTADCARNNVEIYSGVTETHKANGLTVTEKTIHAPGATQSGTSG